MIKQHRLVLSILLLATTLATAGAIKTWASGATLNSADLNNNFAHIHNAMVGGHGARLVDADVSGSAAIALSKIAGISAIILPKAWAHVSLAASGCNTGAYPDACDFTGSGVTGISNTALGVYTVTLSTTPANAAFAVVVNPVTAGGTFDRTCIPGDFAAAAPQFTIKCFDLAAGAATPGFSFIYMDN